MVNDKKHILVIDDEEEIRFLFETKFYKMGYRVSTAATGLQAVQKLRSGTFFDLIICDLKMPKMTGIDFYNEMVQLSPTSKFLLITGFPDRQKLVGAMKNGIVNIMLKPVKHSEIVQKIQELIGGPNKEEAA